MPALSDYLTPPTQPQILTLQLNMMALAGMPVTSWQSGSVPLSLVNADAQTLADMATVIATATQGGLASLAVGPWLDLIGIAQFNAPRKQAVATQGWLTLRDAGGGGPFTIAVNQLYAGPSTTSTLRFQNVAGGVLAQNGTLVLNFQAESPGGVYNVANAAITTLLTPLPGVTVTNVDPGSAYLNGGNGTWISQLGTDAETDGAYFQRLQAKWSTLGTGATTATYKYWALTSTPTVTRVNVLENTPAGGQVTIYCAGSSGPSSGADVTSVQNYIGTVGSNTGTRPLCVTVNVAAATSNVVALSGTVRVKTAFLVVAQSIFAANLAAFTATLDIGATVYFSKLVDLVQSIPGVVEVVFSSPVADIVQSPQQAVSFTNNLVWVGV